MGRFSCLSSSTRQPEPEESDIEITITTADEVKQGEEPHIEVTPRTFHRTIKDLSARDINGEVTIVVGGAEETVGDLDAPRARFGTGRPVLTVRPGLRPSARRPGHATARRPPDRRTRRTFPW